MVKLQSLFFFSNALAGLFLQIFLFKLSGFEQVVVFNFWLFTALLVAYISSGYLLRRWSTRTLIRSGLILLVVAWLSLLLLQDSAKNFITVLGLVFGAGHGFYWSGFNLSQYILTHAEKRAGYFGKVDTLTNTTRAIAPFVAGLMVKIGNDTFTSATRGYYLLFAVVLVLNLYIMKLAFGLPRHSGVKFSIFKMLRHDFTPKWKLVLTQQFISGLYDAAFGTLSGILIFMVLASESHVGLLQSVGALLGAACSFLAGRLYKTHKNIYVYGACMASTALLIFASIQNVYTAVFFILLHSAANPLLNIPTSVAILSGYDEAKGLWQNKYHVFIQRDAVLGVGRMLSYLFVLLLFSLYDKVTAAEKWFFVAATVPLLSAFILYRLHLTSPQSR